MRVRVFNRTSLLCLCVGLMVVVILSLPFITMIYIYYNNYYVSLGGSFGGLGCHGHLTPWAGQVPPTHAGSYSGPAVTPQVTFGGREVSVSILATFIAVNGYLTMQPCKCPL